MPPAPDEGVGGLRHEQQSLRYGVGFLDGFGKGEVRLFVDTVNEDGLTAYDQRLKVVEDERPIFADLELAAYSVLDSDFGG